MKSKKRWRLWVALLPLLMWGTAARAQEESEPALFSKLAAVKLTGNAVRVLPGSVPDTIQNALAQIVQAGGDKVKQGQSEVLAWTGAGYKKARAKQLMQNVIDELKAVGWDAEISGASAEITVISLTRSDPAPRL